MTRYEFSFRQEVMLEKGASILADLFRYGQEKNLTEPNRPVQVMYDLVWTAKQDILLTTLEKELDRIEGQFDLAKEFLSRIETDGNI